MGKIAFVFSGQGAQHPGMAQDLIERYDRVADLFAAADRIRPGTTEQCLRGTQEELKQTENTQPCLYLADLAAAIALEEEGIVPQALAGFSLGEIAALAFGGAFSLEEGFSIVCRRGQLMGEANRQADTGMVAVVKMENAAVETLAQQFDRVYPVNYNCPGQLAVSGAKDSLEAFSVAVRQAGGRAVPLAVSGAFHSPYMNDAAEAFGTFLQQKNLRMPEIPVYSNCTAQPYTEDIASLLTRQMNHPVQWENTIRRLAKEGFDIFIETGVGTTLKKLIQKTLPDALIYAVETAEEAAAIGQEVLSHV